MVQTGVTVENHWSLRPLTITHKIVLSTLHNGLKSKSQALELIGTDYIGLDGCTIWMWSWMPEVDTFKGLLKEVITRSPIKQHTISITLSSVSDTHSILTSSAGTLSSFLLASCIIGRNCLTLAKTEAEK